MNRQPSQQTKDRRLDHEQVFVYFPLSAPSNSSLIYGVIRPNEQYPSSFNVYVVSFEEDVHHQLELLGTWNSDRIQPRNQSSWIEMTSQTFHSKIERVIINGRNVPLLRAVLVLYDETFIQSEILPFNLDWKSSKCLTELSNLLKAKNHINTVEVSPEEKLKDSVVNNSKLIKQLRQRSLQWRAWRKSNNDLAYYNLLLMMLCDLFLGFCFSNLFHMLGGPNEVLEMFLDLVKVFKDNFSWQSM